MPPTVPLPRIEDLAPDPASVAAAHKVLKKGGFETVEATADGTGWWAVCQGLTDRYQVWAKVPGPTGFSCGCDCPSPKHPCKHALALVQYLTDHPEAWPAAAESAPAPDALEPLLRAAFAAPADDLPRLVLADYLEEHGEADRAALIRVQCELARAPKRGDRRRSLVKEERRLLAAVGGQLGEWPLGMEPRFVRGFARLVLGWDALAEADQFPARVAEAFRRGWVEVVEVSDPGGNLGAAGVSLLRQVAEVDFRPQSLTDEDLFAVAADLEPGTHDGRLSRVRLRPADEKRYRAVLSGSSRAARPVGPGGVEHLHDCSARQLDLMARAGRFRHARILSLSGLRDDAAEVLANTPDLAAVERVAVQESPLTALGLTRLVNSTHLTGVTALHVERCPVGDAGAAAVAARTGMPRLTHLEFGSCGLTDAGAAALSGRANGLRSLFFSGDRVGPAGVAAVLAAVSPTTLGGVAFDGGSVPRDRWLELVAEAGDRPALGCNFGGTQFSRQLTAEGMELHVIFAGKGVDPRLFARPLAERTAARLTGLTLNGGPILPDALGDLAEWLRPTAVRRLALVGVGMRNPGAVRLAAELPKLRLEALDLSGNQIGVAGVKALAASPGLAAVKVLDLGGNPLGQAGGPAVLASPHLTAVEELILTGATVTDAEVKAFRKRVGRPVKVRR